MNKRNQTTNLRDILDPLSKQQRKTRDKFMRSIEDFNEEWEDYSEGRSKHNKYLAKKFWMLARGWTRDE